MATAVESSPGHLMAKYEFNLSFLFNSHGPSVTSCISCLPTTECKGTSPSLSYEEHNAIRYKADAVIRALLNKLKKSSHDDKNESSYA